MKKYISIIYLIILCKSISIGQFSYPKEKPFGQLQDGRKVSLYTFKTEKGAEVSITNFGAIITSIKMPDRDSVMQEITTGVDLLEQYEKGTPGYGSTVGRFANRIANGQFSVDNGKTIIQLEQNEFPNALHSGASGFHKKLWEGQIAGNKLFLRYHSPNGEGNYPGNYEMELIVSLSETNELRLVYNATTDAPTIHNVTNHVYFNLEGFGKKPTIKNHLLKIEADNVTEIGKGLIPTGKIIPIANTALDFRDFGTIGTKINAKEMGMDLADGYDHNYVITNKQNELKLHCILKAPKTGRVMEVYSSEPGLQFYSGNFMKRNYPHRKNEKYRKRAALCLETQHFPDSPNHKNFPSTILLPGEKFKSVTVYKFGIEK